VVSPRGQSRHARDGRDDTGLGEPWEKGWVVDSVRIAKMAQALRIQPAFGERSAVVANLTKKEILLFRCAVSVRVKLDVGDGWIERCDLIGLHQGEQAAMKKLLPIQPQL